MTDKPRLIEYAFPLKQASLDSVHEKNVRHGHISTLHIWPARRPLAACRAALIATLLPDPGTPEKRQELCEKIGGKVVKKIERKKMPGGRVVEREKEETEGGILHWKRETENAETLEWFRQEIRKAYGGRPVPLIDQAHRLMHLWRGGDVHKVDEYLDDRGLRRHELFNRLLQSLIELSQPGSDERPILESLSNHIGAKGAKKTDPQKALAFGDDE